jgi:hypothetical protein
VYASKGNGNVHVYIYIPAHSKEASSYFSRPLGNLIVILVLARFTFWGYILVILHGGVVGQIKPILFLF